MNNLKYSIQLLIKILHDPNCVRMSKSTVKGFLAELYVKEKLESEGAIVIHKGNQSGYDLLINDKIRIDVKSSTIKGSKQFPDWGWALRTKPLSKVSFTHLVCVAYDKNFNAVKFVVINVNDLELFPDVKGRFHSVKRSFSLMLDGIDYPNNEYFNSCKKLLEKEKVKIINESENLLELLKIEH